MVENKKYLLTNHSDKKGFRSQQLSLAFTGTGATLLPGRSAIVKADKLNDHLISLGRNFKSKVKGSWLEISEYRPKVEVKETNAPSPKKDVDVKTEEVKVEDVKTEEVKVEDVKTESTKADAEKTETAKAESVKKEVKSGTASKVKKDDK